MFVFRDGKELVDMQPAAFASEDDFQKLLSDFPLLLMGQQIDADNPRRWLLVSREMGIASDDGAANRWSLDHLFLDQDGIPTLVEVKRQSDSRIRREVIGQMLDYAANGVVYWPESTIRSAFEATCAVKGYDPAVEIAKHCGGEVDPGNCSPDLGEWLRG